MVFIGFLNHTTEPPVCARTPSYHNPNSAARPVGERRNATRVRLIFDQVACTCKLHLHSSEGAQQDYGQARGVVKAGSRTVDIREGGERGGEGTLLTSPKGRNAGGFGRAA